LETFETADWRLDTLASLRDAWTSPWTGQISPAGTLIKKVTVARLSRKQTLTVSIPNATALFMNIARRAFSDAQSVRRQHIAAKPGDADLSLDDATAFRYLECMFEAVICAHTAVEAYVNELLPSDVTYERKNRQGEVEMLSKDQVERKASLAEKISTMLPKALGVASPKGVHRAYSDLQALTKIRDRLIHMKSVDRKSSGPEIDTIWHQLLTCDSPIEQAMSVIRYFAPTGEAKPRWLSNMPKS